MRESGRPRYHSDPRALELRDMLEIQAKDFVFAIQALVSIENIMEANQAADSDDKIESDVICETILGSLRLFHSSCRTLAASITEIPVNNLIKELEDRECTYKRTTTEIRKIRGRFTDELGETKLFVLPSAYAQFYFGALASFGFDIVEKFSYKAAEDVEEAGRCLAVGRSTACVFHLMRAMEEAVKVLGTRLGVQNVEKEWGKILSDLARKIETMPRGSKRDEWSSCYANLYHVKQAWRNSTMHPKETYTSEQAKEVLDAVRAFMRQLAMLD